MLRVLRRDGGGLRRAALRQLLPQQGSHGFGFPELVAGVAGVAEQFSDIFHLVSICFHVISTPSHPLPLVSWFDFFKLSSVAVTPTKPSLPERWTQLMQLGSAGGVLVISASWYKAWHQRQNRHFTFTFGLSKIQAFHGVPLQKNRACGTVEHSYSWVGTILYPIIGILNQKHIKLEHTFLRRKECMYCLTALGTWDNLENASACSLWDLSICTKLWLCQGGVFCETAAGSVSYGLRADGSHGPLSTDETATSWKGFLWIGTEYCRSWTASTQASHGQSALVSFSLCFHCFPLSLKSHMDQSLTFNGFHSASRVFPAIKKVGRCAIAEMRWNSRRQGQFNLLVFLSAL